LSAEAIDEAGTTAPRFRFTGEDRAALQAFLQTDRKSLDRAVPVEDARRLMAALRCAVCHGRDGELNRLDDVLFEESVSGKPPEQVPDLTWAGEKLRAPWARRFIAGELDYRPRPWLKIRMPAFPADAARLARGMASEHGMPADVVEDTTPLDTEEAASGERLTRQAPQGFFCTECHAVGSRPPAGAFEHKGVNFALVTERMHHDYYTRWITNPQRLDPGTKMPTFSSDGKTTQIKSEYGGDAQKQFEAIWEYLRSLERE
jgi:mono/diheme cytochrome c family protein